LKKCSLTKFGVLGSLKGKNFYFGLYNFSEHPSYPNEGIIVFEGYSDNLTEDYIKPVIFHAQMDIMKEMSGSGYSEPRIFGTKYGPILEISCVLWGGSAVAYDFKYFLWSGSRWVLLDNESWMAELSTKLPKGLSTLNYEPIDLNNLVYVSYLWREGDAHCCPTGGRVRVNLKIHQYRFTIDRVTILK
jgi:hypothetical protein